MSETRTLEAAVPMAAIPAAQDAPLVVRASGLPVEEIEVLKATICAKLSEPQLLLFLTICKRRGVDPFTEAYAFPNSDGGLAFGLRIDGMRTQAMRTGLYVSRKVETLTEPADAARVIGARCTVVRKGMEPVVEEAYLKEYDRGGLGWKQFPETMIRKVAESKALRAAFPDALAGVYEPAEMEEVKA